MISKENIKEIINLYQNQINDYVNITDDDISEIYLETQKTL